MNENNVYRTVTPDVSVSTYTRGVVNFQLCDDGGEPLDADNYVGIVGATLGQIGNYAEVSAWISTWTNGVPNIRLRTRHGDILVTEDGVELCAAETGEITNNFTVTATLE